MFNIKEKYEELLRDTNFKVKEDNIGNIDNNVKKIYLRDDYDISMDEYYELMIVLDLTTKLIQIKTYLSIDTVLNYQLDKTLIIKILKKTIEISKELKIKKILVNENIINLYMSKDEYILNKETELEELGFKYVNDDHINKNITIMNNENITKIKLIVIYIIIIKKTSLNSYELENLYELEKYSINIHNILKNVKLIYKKNKKLKDFKLKMEDIDYWEIVKKEIYQIFGIKMLSNLMEYEN
jgi:hypothetical protein